MTWTRTDTGKYTATFTAGQVTNANYAITGSAFSSSGGGEGRNLSIDASLAKDTTNFSIIIRQNSGGSRRDVSFSVVVFGGR
jgi:hypothetical protein